MFSTKLWANTVRKRVLLDEHLSEDIAGVFGPRDHVYLAKDVDLKGKPDRDVIDFAINKKCLIITNDAGLVNDYRNHPQRRSKRGIQFFYGLIYVRADSDVARKRHIAIAVREMAWGESRQHDDLVIVSRDGKTEHYRLCHAECAAEFDKREGRSG